MDLHLTALILGIVEGLTEFIPVSSTGHLILATALLGFDADKWATFNVVIQLGAILAVVVLYWKTFLDVLLGLIRLDGKALRFVRNILAAFLPSAVIGLALKHVIDRLLGEPGVVAWALIAGGIAILLIERWKRPRDPGPFTTSPDVVEPGVANLPLKTAIGVGVVQCLAMIPGVSRSGATIMGALAMGVDRRTAAEFSFFLAIPTMLGATTLELIDSRHALAAATGPTAPLTIAIGFITAFFVALGVIRLFVAYVSRSGFSPFGWYRIVAGIAALAWLSHG